MVLALVHQGRVCPRLAVSFRSPKGSLSPPFSPPTISPPPHPQLQWVSVKWGQGPPPKPPGTEPPATCQRSEARCHAPHLHTTRLQGKPLIPVTECPSHPVPRPRSSVFLDPPARAFVEKGSPLCHYSLPACRLSREMVVMGLGDDGSVG